MTISAESIRKIEFREGWRGYNQVDVDVFLEEVAAGVDELHTSLAELKARAERAESRVAAPGVTRETDETVRRTLTLAQRAADLVVGESKAVAERIVADANAQATRLHAEAVAAAAAVSAASQAEANEAIAKRHTEADVAHEHHVAKLAAQRESLDDELDRRRRELDDLRSLTAATRDRLRAALTDHLARLDQLDGGGENEFGVAAPSAVPTIAVPDLSAPLSGNVDAQSKAAALAE